jgi:hypothetical protein
MELTVAKPPRRQTKPNPITGELNWEVDLLVVTGDDVDVIRVSFPDSGLGKNLVPLTPVDLDELILRLWVKPDGRHGEFYVCDAIRAAVATNGSATKTAVSA